MPPMLPHVSAVDFDHVLEPSSAHVQNMLVRHAAPTSSSRGRRTATCRVAPRPRTTAGKNRHALH
eukprot:1575687-Prymnesium_polylepis.1